MTSNEKAKKLLRTAAEPVLKRIRADQRGLKSHMSAMLDLVAERLFDCELTPPEVLEAAGVKDNALWSAFHRALGLPPWAYVEECRLEIAVRLLEGESELKVGYIGELVGFASLQSFSQAFERWTGERPSSYRRRSQRYRERGVTLVDAAMLRRCYRQRAESRELTAATITELVRSLAAIYGLKPREVDEPVEHSPEDRLAQAVWSKWRGRSPEVAATALLRWGGCFRTPALVRYLLEVSRLEARKDLRRAVWIAERAVEVIVPLSATMAPQEIAELQVETLAKLANLRRRSGDHAGANRELCKVDELLADTEVSASLEAEVLFFKALLAICERRVEDARDLANRACLIAEHLEDDELFARALMARGTAQRRLESFAASIGDFERAVTVLQGSPDLYLRYAAQQNLASTLTLAGRLEEGRAALGLAREVAAKAGWAEAQLPDLEWLAAIVEWKAGRRSPALQHFVEARRTFSQIGDAGHAAVVSLEMALLLLEAGRIREVGELLLETLPQLEALRLDGEWEVAVGLLRRSIESDGLEHRLIAELHARLSNRYPSPAA